MDEGSVGDARREATSSRQSMRAFLSALAKTDDLVSLSEPVNLDYEIAACLAETDGGPALQFENVEGPFGAATMPVVGNLLNSLPRFALALGSTTRAMQEALIDAIEKP